MPTYQESSKPTTAYTEIGEAFNRLLINATDFLLINASGDRLAISDRGIDLYNEIVKPTTSYSVITRPS